MKAVQPESRQRPRVIPNYRLDDDGCRARREAGHFSPLLIALAPFQGAGTKDNQPSQDTTTRLEPIAAGAAFAMEAETGGIRDTRGRVDPYHQDTPARHRAMPARQFR